MHESTILLISADVPLIEAVRDCVRIHPKLNLQTVAEQADAWQRGPSRNVVLRLVHLRRRNDAAGVKRFLERPVAGGRPLPTILLFEPYLAPQLTDLSHSSSVESMNRPFDLTKIMSLANELVDVHMRSNRHEDAESAPSIQSLGDQGSFFFLPSSSMAQLMQRVEKIAPQDSSILITGETGTGKTHLARQIHQLSPRRAEPFMVIHCGALSANLIERKMFGHCRDAYTGADRDRVGKFEASGRGTVLLDEIDTLPLDLQVKLLRVVDERVFESVGANHSVRLQARLIAATNRAITDEVAAHRFRADLLYRLNVVEFELQPLRRCRELIPFLADHFLMDFVHRNGRSSCGLADAAVLALQQYHWPGNIRELRNVIERAVALSAGSEIRLEDLPSALRAPRDAAATTPVNDSSEVGDELCSGLLGKERKDAEVTRIRQALYRNKNNRRRAASELGISRMTLYNKLHRYGFMGTTS